MIPFNKPYLSGKELEYIEASVKSGKISGDGLFTKKCQQFFEEKYKMKKTLLTTSCTDALEMCAILGEFMEGDEIIAPSYTFVSTVNPFIMRGAKIVFADSRPDNPNIDEHKIAQLITTRTKAIVVVHYAGISCNMEIIQKIADDHKLIIIEDAAQAIDSYYKGKLLGTIGDLSAFSFHETKNIISGEGGMICINRDKYIERAEIIREKGTDRSKFFRGEIDKYGWVDIGSSFLPSDIIAAYLFAQLENLENIQTRRKQIWNKYHEGFQNLPNKGILLPNIPNYATNNAHMYYLVCNSNEERSTLIKFLKENGIYAVFHYQSLHKSSYFENSNKSIKLPYADRYTSCLVRLPLFFELTDSQVNYIIEKVNTFFKN